MDYAHWLIVAGAVLVVLGFIGFALHKNDAEPADARHILGNYPGRPRKCGGRPRSEAEGEGEMMPKRQRWLNGI
jgi:hypothetical protein